ncbi:hypothetical protein [Streptomyces glaucescens]|uniref:Toxin-antitoxin system, toxin component n=1 Tax=Streptomyces glaucescens TaxID=1907 RepID=A0A089XJS5_STRGA|nr:hypothetical protein [Streptomyces glaucescens]AIS02237.1 hypothetical protein SGLAU_31515 [Streptomyces glaucescens]
MTFDRSSQSKSGIRTVRNADVRTMRRLTNDIIECLQPSDGENDLASALGVALSRVRGRPVRLREAVFPPETASGLWIDAPEFDFIVYEQNTDPVHQRVIIGHEAWHMFAGHCGSPTAHGTAATRALHHGPTNLLEDFVRRVTETDAVGSSSLERMDAALHVAALRAESPVDEEAEAEMFGLRLATALHASLAEARATADPGGIAGRIQVSMAHRRHRA